MTTGTTISCVIPTFNRAGLVERAVESALSQTRPPNEIVVVDDGSTDDTRDSLRSFGSLVHYVHQQNRGGAGARNRGVEAAGGDWIAFLDSDDVWVTDHLERTERVIESTDGRGSIYFGDTRRSSADGGGSLWDISGFRVGGDFEIVEDGTDWAMRPLQPFMLQSSVIRRDHYLESGGLRTDLARRHDTDLFFRLALGRSVCAVAGAGSRMGDEDSTGRLTSVWDDRSVVYWQCSIQMYARLADLRSDPSVKDVFSGRLAVSHWRLARLRWTQGRLKAAGEEVARAMLASPWTMIRVLGYGAWRLTTRNVRRADRGEEVAIR